MRIVFDTNILVDDRILFEYRDVLRRPKFAFPKDAFHPLYEVAAAGDADYLVTGNVRHFPETDDALSSGLFGSVARDEMNEASGVPARRGVRGGAVS